MTQVQGLGLLPCQQGLPSLLLYRPAGPADACQSQLEAQQQGCMVD